MARGVTNMCCHVTDRSMVKPATIALRANTCCFGVKICHVKRSDVTSLICYTEVCDLATCLCHATRCDVAKRVGIENNVREMLSLK